MNLNLFKVCKEYKLNFTQFKLLAYLIIMSDNNLHACFASNNRIGEDIGVSGSYVSTCISNLKKKDLISVTSFPKGKVIEGEEVAERLVNKKYKVWRLIFVKNIDRSLRVSTSMLVKGLSQVKGEDTYSVKHPPITGVKTTVINSNCIKYTNTNSYKKRHSRYCEKVPDYINPVRSRSQGSNSNSSVNKDIAALMNRIENKTVENNKCK